MHYFLLLCFIDNVWVSEPCRPVSLTEKASGWCVFMLGNLAVSFIVCSCLWGIPVCSFQGHMDAFYELSKPNQFSEEAERKPGTSVGFYTRPMVARSASSVDNAAVLCHNWFPCRQTSFCLLAQSLWMGCWWLPGAVPLTYYLQHGTFSDDIGIHTYSGGENHIKYIKD